jgi:diacylglycerol O-acyltransferase / wax synthase
MSESIRRLTAADASNLSYETPAAPFHIGAIATLEAAPLIDAGGILRMSVIKGRLERRLANLPQMRRRLRVPGPLRGRPIWVDDPSFAIDHHVFSAAVSAPGEEVELLATAERIMRPRLDRSRPPWELWFLTGLSDGRVGLVLKLHHAITDGMGAIGLMGRLLDLEADAPDPDPVAWSPAAVPSGWALFVDNLRGRACALVRAGRALLHPHRFGQAAGDVVGEVWAALRDFNRAPKTSIDGPIRPGRELRVVRMGLADAKEVAHRASGKVNDVILAVVAGGLRTLLATRGETVDGVELIVSVPVSLRAAGAGDALGNQVGVMVVPLPIGESDSHRRLELIAAITAAAKAEQKTAHVEAAMTWLSATPLAHVFVTRQRMVNTFATNVAGPPVLVYLLGARVLDALPFVPLGGNVRISFGVLSYAGTLGLMVVADATTSPDIVVLAEGIRTSWLELVPAAFVPLVSTLPRAPQLAGPPTLGRTATGS